MGDLAARVFTMTDLAWAVLDVLPWHFDSCPPYALGRRLTLHEPVAPGIAYAHIIARLDDDNVIRVYAVLVGQPD